MYLLQLEWKKVITNRAFKIASVMYFILLPLMFLSADSLFSTEKEVDGASVLDSFAAYYSFPQIWDSMAYFASWLTFFLFTYIVVAMVSSEYEFKTARQNIITGLSRNEYLLGKLQLILLLITVATLYMALMVFVFGTMAGGFGKAWGAEKWVVFYFFVQTLFYSSFAFMLAIIVRKSGVTMLLFFSYILIIERIIYYLGFLQLLDNPSIANYLPASVAWFSVPFYLAKANAMGLMEDVGNGNVVFMEASVAVWPTLAYSILFWAISFWRFNRQDL